MIIKNLLQEKNIFNDADTLRNNFVTLLKTKNYNIHSCFEFNTACLLRNCKNFEDTSLVDTKFFCFNSLIQYKENVEKYFLFKIIV